MSDPSENTFDLAARELSSPSLVALCGIGAADLVERLRPGAILVWSVAP